jgi:hypothetical protein
VIALRSRQRQQWLRQRQQSAVVSQSAVAASATIAPCVLFFLFTYTGWPTVPGLGAAVCWHSHAERMLLHEMPLLAAGFWIGMAGGAYRLSACASLVHVRDVYAWPQSAVAAAAALTASEALALGRPHRSPAARSPGCMAGRSELAAGCCGGGVRGGASKGPAPPCRLPSRPLPASHVPTSWSQGHTAVLCFSLQVAERASARTRC